MDGELLGGGVAAVDQKAGRPQALRAATFRSLNVVARSSIFLLVAGVALDGLALVTDIQMIGFLDRVRAGGDVTMREAQALDSRMALTGLMQVAAYAVAGIPFILWFRRAYRNLYTFGIRKARFKAGWAVGGWFVPFLAFARPKSIANDIWRASDPSLPTTADEPPPGGRVSPLLNWWWGWFVATHVLYSAARWGEGGSSVRAAIGDARSYAYADAASVIAGVLAILVVRAVTQRQEQRHARVQAAPAEGPA